MMAVVHSRKKKRMKIFTRADVETEKPIEERQRHHVHVVFVRTE